MYNCIYSFAFISFLPGIVNDTLRVQRDRVPLDSSMLYPGIQPTFTYLKSATDPTKKVVDYVKVNNKDT